MVNAFVISLGRDPATSKAMYDSKVIGEDDDFADPKNPSFYRPEHLRWVPKLLIQWAFEDFLFENVNKGINFKKLSPTGCAFTLSAFPLSFYDDERIKVHNLAN